MGTIISHSDLDTTEEVGRVFTPLAWAIWCIKNFGVYQQWIQGASIIDPTCGQGVFFEALFLQAQKNNYQIRQTDLLRLTGIEITPSDKDHFLQLASNKYRIDFPEKNFITSDFLDVKGNNQFDIAVGNPPWVNFTDLSSIYKSTIKNYFIEYGLVKNKQSVLLGASRIDMASLILKKVMKDHVKPNGLGLFFVPLSIFFNEEANREFRPQSGTRNTFSVQKIFDFESGLVFKDIHTRNGFIHLKRDGKQHFPVALEKLHLNGKESLSWCRPAFPKGAWIQSQRQDQGISFHLISVERKQVPRQGMNSCGQNKVFILERQDMIDHHCNEPFQLTNGFGNTVSLESQFLLPLMHAGLFGRKKPSKIRYILCLHNRDGSALGYDDLEQFPLTLEYLNQYRDEMTHRKGVLIQSIISKNGFWSLLGVGAYSFSKYKISWESLGRSEFKAVVLDGRWQGNQAMHSYIPSPSLEDATRICTELNDTVPNYLKSFGMEGTCNWAQPGRIKHLLVHSDLPSLFS
ncbi:MAG: hypothetical protein OXF84_02080 [Bacteroidetes bacterium]|nr:hypothetical protein [Bacteroidota bacterium]